MIICILFGYESNAKKKTTTINVLTNVQSGTYIKKRNRRGIGARAQRRSLKHIGNTYCHMQGARLNVIAKVHLLHDMHPGNMWKGG